MTMHKNDDGSLGRRDLLALLGLAAGASLAAPLEELTQSMGLAQAAGTAPPRIPHGAIVRTVLQDLPPDALRTGATLMHEHLLGGFYSSPPRQAALAAPPPPGRGAEGRGAPGRTNAGPGPR